MENFIFSINVTFPIFLVMVIGYILKQIGMLNDNFVTVANKFNFKVTLPFMLFRDISGVDIRAVFDLKYVLSMGLLAFGGVCAAFQTKCIIDKAGLSFRQYIKEKLITAMVTSLFAISYLLLYSRFAG